MTTPEIFATIAGVCLLLTVIGQLIVISHLGHRK